VVRFIGQTGRSIETRIKEHHRHIRLYHPDKSAVAEHSMNLGHRIQFQDTRILATRSGHVEFIIKEAMEIELHSDNMNREEGFFLSKLWKPLLQTLKERKKTPFSKGKVTYT
jgi:hypothetical protein